MVDHHFANASQGAIGLVSTSAKPPAKDLEHHNMPASATPTDPDAVAGKLAFESKCLACHSVGEGRKLGPDVAGVTKRRSSAWLARWLKEPEKMLETDPDAKAMLKEYNNLPMPNQSLGEAEIRQYLKYFEWIDKQPAGTVKSFRGRALRCASPWPLRALSWRCRPSRAAIASRTRSPPPTTTPS
jgi:nitrite reductase (NO-forming)